MSLADAFIEPEARHRAYVMHVTWGHLEQKRGTDHKGWFVFASANYGGAIELLDSDWEGDLDDSPGLYTAMYDYACDHCERGVVHRLEGKVTRYKNGKYRISGKRVIVNLKPKKKK
jgi:hypothetical protein